MVIFVAITSAIFIPAPVSIKQNLFPLMAFLSIAYFLLGISLVFLTLKEKVKGRLKKFLLLTGACATGFLPSVLFHNFLYGLSVLSAEVILLHNLLEVLHAAFFIIAILACPLGFLIGAVASVVLFFRKRKK